MSQKLHVHFMGILGSGCASIALLAAKEGFRVSGCDMSETSYYQGVLKENGVEIFKGHDEKHLENDVDIVAVSPAIFDINPNCPELLEAKKRGILMTWQQFMGEYLQKGKRVICISGTHGKTTSTFLCGEMLIQGGIDPTVEGGSVYHKWNAGGREGNSDVFLCEADEFNRNFYHYSPEIVVMNNVEMDHPECFKDVEEVYQAFAQFATQKHSVKTMILYGESFGCNEVFRRIQDDEMIKKAQVFVIFKDEAKDIGVSKDRYHEVVFHVTKRSEEGTEFTYTLDGIPTDYAMRLTGDYNAQNASTAITISRVLGVKEEDICTTLATFGGAGRRFDKVGMRRNVPVYDDYAHHPTEIRSLLTMCRDYFKDRKIVAVFEPHQISRLRLMFEEYAEALTLADHAFVWRTHMGREIHTGAVPIPGAEWEAYSKKIRYEEDMEKIVEGIDQLIDEGECDMAVIIGAASSYLISKRLVEGK